MATRSAIGVAYEDRIEAIYCHWDGYLSHNGKILNEHYNRDAAKKLITLGDLSSLGAGIGLQHSREERPAGECTFYGRDFGQTNVEAVVYSTAEEFQFEMSHRGCEYYYILGTDNQWWVSCEYGPLRGTWTPVSEALKIVRQGD